MGARNYLEKVLKSTCISAKNTKISFKFYNNIALTIPFLNSLHVKKNMGMQNPFPEHFPIHCLYTNRSLALVSKLLTVS